MQLPWWWRCKETSVKYISSGFKLNPCVPCVWIQWKSMDHIMSSVELLTVLPDWSVWTPQWPVRYQDGRAAFHHGWPPDELYHGIQSTRTDFATFTNNYNNNIYFFVKTSLQRFEYYTQKIKLCHHLLKWFQIQKDSFNFETQIFLIKPEKFLTLHWKFIPPKLSMHKWLRDRKSNSYKLCGLIHVFC